MVGTLFVLTWATALGAVVHAGSPNLPAFAVAIAYPLTDLVLVAIVVLLVATRRAPRPLRPQLWLLGSGLVALSVSDSIFAYLVSSGADDMPPATNAGFIAGPLLIAVAALVTADGQPGPRHARRRTTTDRAHLLLPYVLVATTGTVVALQSAFGDGIDAVETALIWIVLVLVLARQVVTLLENAVLLDRLSASQVELSRQAHHDPLTGLANRALFTDRLQEAIDRHARLDQPFAVLVIDLDDFKQVNDLLGHVAGDHLLYAVAQRLRGTVRSIDTVARLGGDEFAIVLADDAEAAASVAERVLVALRHPFSVAGHTIPLGASVGVVEPGPDEQGVTPDVLRQPRRPGHVRRQARGEGGRGAVPARARRGAAPGRARPCGLIAEGPSRRPRPGRAAQSPGSTPKMVAVEPEPALLRGPPTSTQAPAAGSEARLVRFSRLMRCRSYSRIDTA